MYEMREKFYTYAVFAMIVFLLCSGCAGKRVLTEEQRSFLGSKGVITVVPGASAELYVPVKNRGEGFVYGFLGGAFIGFIAPFSGGGGGGASPELILAVGGAFAAVGAVVGAVWGPIAAVPEEQKKDELEKLKAILNGFDAGAIIAEDIKRLSFEKAGRVLEVEKDAAAKGADYVVEVNVERIILSGSWSVGQKFSFRVSAKVRLLSKGVMLYERRFPALPLKTEEKKLDEWLARDAFALKEAFNAACRSIAETAVEDMFLQKEKK